MRIRVYGSITLLLGAAACAASPTKTPQNATTGPSQVAIAGPGACARQNPGVGAARLASERQGGPIALAKSAAGHVIAYVADADEPSLHTIDVDDTRVAATTDLPGVAEQVLVLADGRVAVTLRADNKVIVLEPRASEKQALATICQTDVASEPIALASTPDDASIVVTSGWGHALTMLDASSLAASFTVDLPREPRAVVVSDDGKRAFVSHVVGAKLTTVDLDVDPSGHPSPGKHDPREIALGAKKATLDTNIGKPAGTRRLGCQGYALAKSIELEPGGDPTAPIGEHPTIVVTPKPPPPTVIPPTHPRPQTPPPPIVPPTPIPGRLFAPFVTVDPGESGRTAYYGAVDGVPTELSQISVIDVPAERKLTNAAFGPKQRAYGARRGARDCMLPRAAVVDGGTLYVTCLGANTLVAYDARALDPARAELRRVDVPRGPTGVAVDAEHRRALVWSQFAHQVSIVAIDAPLTAPVATVPIARKAAFKLSDQAEHGRDLYFGAADTSLSTEGMACASCHPDGREDAITWSTLEGPRQTPMLAGRLADTAPYAWSGAHHSLEEHLQDTVRKLRGSGLQQDEYESIVAYLGTMKAPTVEVDHSHDVLVAAGRKVFESAETACATCHDESKAFTDGKTHDVGTGLAAVDTPSLRFVGGTAPYFHDGRYATLAEAIDAPDHTMGHTQQLSRNERLALVAYLESL